MTARTATIRTLLLGIGISVLMGSCAEKESKDWTLVPYPNSVSVVPGVFSLEEGVTISSSNPELESTVDYFKELAANLNIATDNGANQLIVLEINQGAGTNEEGYELNVSEDEIKIVASHPKGIFYGLMTVWQELKLSGSKKVPCGIVKDEPRFGYRGFMLDESRYFYGKEKVKQLINYMSVFKLNTFHWHLTDAPGWRIEIKSLPKLTTVGGKGNKKNPDAPVKYYTQAEIKEVIAYAAERFITIIPEIDMPGHATAANRAYPQFSGGGSEKRPDFTFDPGQEGTYIYLTKILKEVAELFPSKYIHLGGDEVHFGNQQWGDNDSIQYLMEKEGLADLKEVEHYFMKRMTDTVETLGKQVAGWDEIIDAGADNTNTLVFWWRHDNEEALQKALDGGFNTILCPRRPLYFDFLQLGSHTNGRRWKGYCPIEDVYNYPDSTHQFSESEIKNIKGIQGQLWSERFDSDQWFDFMTYPRMMALSEAAWTQKESKNIERFNSTLPHIFKYLDEEAVYYFNPLDTLQRAEPVSK